MTRDSRTDFVIVGAQKCGTTSLAHQLQQHPGVCFCDRKEPHYFSTQLDWRRGLSGYHALFSPCAGQICGEASTSYTFLPEFPGTAERLHAYNSELRLIYVVRHPIERIESQVLHDALRGRVVGKAPEEIVLANPIYVDRSRYASQMEPYVRLFGASRIRLLVFEDYVTDPGAALRGLAVFLGIDPRGWKELDLSPRNASAVQGHLRRLPAHRALRSLFYRLPKTRRNRVWRWVQGRGRSLFYRRAESRIRLPPAVREEIWRRLGDEVPSLEQIFGRSLPTLRRRPS